MISRLSSLKKINSVSFIISVCFFICLSFILLSFSLVYIYSNNLLDRYYYLGWQPLNYSFYNLTFIFLTILFITWLFPKKLLIPSDWFLIIYSIEVLFPNILFVTVGYPLSIESRCLFFAVLALPAILIKSVHLRIGIPLLPSINIRLVVITFVITILVWVFVIILYGSGLSLNWATQYERRLDLRELFDAGSFAAYLGTMVCNGFGPFISFLGMFYKRYLLILLSIITAILAFAISGAKQPLLLIIMALFLGRQFRLKRETMLGIWILIFFIGLSVISIAEIYSGMEVQYITDIIIRRIFVNPAVLQAYYYDLITQTGAFTTGVSKEGYSSISFVIGRLYLLNDANNANTNTFLFSLISYGAIGYIVNIVIVFTLFHFLDASYKKAQSVFVMFVAFLLSQMISEQFVGTALLSSGMAILIILSTIVSSPEEYNETIKFNFSKFYRKN